MKWMPAIIALAVLVLVFRLRAESDIAEQSAREKLKAGALLIDVRTVEEFNAMHLTNAVNLPLADIGKSVEKRVPNKGSVLLLHCRSGARSGKAEKELRALGYTNVFNVGSYEQAQKVVGGKD